ncbi:hypothetical protein [Candidatus Enterovibrio escicola]|nr:hypothetical protein [Candidatus Enterovibrio escacola]
MNKPFYLPISEVITIIVSFRQSIFPDFKTDYTHFICHHIIVKSHDVVNSTRMLTLMKSALVPLFSYLTHRQAKPTGNTFVDSAKLQIYHNLSIPRHCRFG